jgi:hypothetical protein
MQNSRLEYFFNHAKDGDAVGFYRPALLAYVIRLFQDLDKTNNLNKVCHCGTIYEVKRNKFDAGTETLEFMLSHQTGSHGGCYDKWTIKKDIIGYNNECEYSILVDTKYIDFYYLNLDVPFTQKEKEKGIKDAKEQIGKMYGYFSFVAYIPFVSNLLGKIAKKPTTFAGFKRVCSKHVLINSQKAGRNVLSIIDENPFPTPEYILTCNKKDLSGTLHKIIDFKECVVK